MNTHLRTNIMDHRKPSASLVARSADIVGAQGARLSSLRDFCPSGSGVAA